MGEAGGYPVTGVERVSRDAAFEVMRTVADRLATLVPEVTDRVLAEVRTAVPEARRLPLDLHRSLVRRGLDTGVQTLRCAAGERPDLSYATDIGRRCADLGLPLDAVLRTYLVAGRRLWEAVIVIVADTDPARLAVLPYTAIEFWQVIDEESLAAAQSYQQGRWEQVRRSRERTRALLEALLAGRGDDPAVARAAAAALGLPDPGRFMVVILRGAGDGEPGRDSMDPAGSRFIWTVRGDRDVALVDLGDIPVDEVVAELRRTTDRHTAVSPVVTRLVDLGQACRLAEIALRTCVRPGPELARVDRRLAAAVVAAQSDLTATLTRSVDPAGQLTPLERSLLMDTFTTWLDNGGSVTRTAAKLFCHRNTVSNRLRRLFAASARSVDRPWDLVELTLATLATRMEGQDR
jgi:hypothetical protein